MKPFPSLGGVRVARDALAATTLVALAIPEQLATAHLAGVPAAQGVVVFAICAVVMVLVARDGALSVGADSTTAPVIAVALAGAAAPGTAATIAAMVGLVLCALALFRLEGLARLLSLPVAAGMMTGIALHILAGRLPVALGLSLAPASVMATLAGVWTHLGEAHLAPLALTGLVAGICLAGRALDRRLPAPLLALAVAVALAAWFDPDARHLARYADTAGSWGLVPPALDVNQVLALLPAALTVAFLCLFQTTVVLRQGERDTPALRRNALGAVGLCNLTVALLGGFAVNSSPPRTQLLRDSGASSQLAGLGAAAIGIGVLALAPGALGLLPEAALAGVLVYVALHLLPFATLRRLPALSPSEAAIAVATMTLVTLLPLQSGLPLAMLLSLVHATLPLFVAQVVELHHIPGTTIWWHGPAATPDGERPDVQVLALTSPINFANAESITREVRDLLHARRPPPRLLVLEGAGLLYLDLTGADGLTALVTELRAAGVDVALARVESDRAREQLARCGVLEVLGPDHLFESVDLALRALATPRPG
ncbi:MAG: SulP family inorganic anion transporter [Gammaproteobacteria bacterium]|nr:SulP family inorganic anion transporter [Gammaproteobacteria bacterium]